VCSKYILKKQFRLHTKLHDGAADTLGRGDTLGRADTLGRGDDLDTSREDEQEEEMDDQEEDEMEEGEANVTNTNQKEVSSKNKKKDFTMLAACQYFLAVSWLAELGGRRVTQCCGPP
jgi:hypothetical protein